MKSSPPVRITSSLDNASWARNRASEFEVRPGHDTYLPDRGGLSLQSIAIPFSCLQIHPQNYLGEKVVEISLGYRADMDACDILKHVLSIPLSILPNVDLDYNRTTPRFRAVLSRVSRLFENGWNEVNLPGDDQAPAWEDDWNRMFLNTVAGWKRLLETPLNPEEKRGIIAFFQRMRNKGSPAGEIAEKTRRTTLEQEEQRARLAWEKDRELERLYRWKIEQKELQTPEEKQAALAALQNETEWNRLTLAYKKALQVLSFFNYKQRMTDQANADLLAENQGLQDQVSALTEELLDPNLTESRERQIRNSLVFFAEKRKTNEAQIESNRAFMQSQAVSRQESERVIASYNALASVAGSGSSGSSAELKRKRAEEKGEKEGPGSAAERPPLGKKSKGPSPPPPASSSAGSDSMPSLRLPSEEEEEEEEDTGESQHEEAPSFTDAFGFDQNNQGWDQALQDDEDEAAAAKKTTTTTTPPSSSTLLPSQSSSSFEQEEGNEEQKEGEDGLGGQLDGNGDDDDDASMAEENPNFLLERDFVTFTNLAYITLPFLPHEFLHWKEDGERTRKELFDRYMKLFRDLTEKTMIVPCMGFSYEKCNQDNLFLELSFAMPVDWLYEVHLVAPLEFFQLIAYKHYQYIFNHPSMAMTFDNPELVSTFMNLKTVALEPYLNVMQFRNLIFVECQELESQQVCQRNRPILKMIPFDMSAASSSHPGEFFCYEAAEEEIVALKTRDISTLHFSLRDYRGELLNGTSLLYTNTERQPVTLLSYKVHTL